MPAQRIDLLPSYIKIGDTYLDALPGESEAEAEARESADNPTDAPDENHSENRDENPTEEGK